jgi:hypothetical protein
MNYVVSIYSVLSSEVRRYNHDNLPDAIARANKAINHPRVNKVEISLILHTMPIRLTPTDTHASILPLKRGERR